MFGHHVLRRLNFFKVLIKHIEFLCDSTIPNLSLLKHIEKHFKACEIRCRRPSLFLKYSSLCQMIESEQNSHKNGGVGGSWENSNAMFTLNQIEACSNAKVNGKDNQDSQGQNLCLWRKCGSSVELFGENAT